MHLWIRVLADSTGFAVSMYKPLGVDNIDPPLSLFNGLNFVDTCRSRPEGSYLHEI